MKTVLAALALTVLSLVGARLAFPARQSSIAIAVSALPTLGTTLEDPATAGLMFDVVVLGVMVNELMGPPLLKRVLAAGDELVDAG